MNELWSMFFTLQLVCFLKFYSIPVPSNIEIYRDEFIKLIQFELLKPEKFIQIFNPDFNMMAYIKGKKVMIVSKAQEASILNDM